MKNLTVFVTLFLLLVAGTAFGGPNLDGTWCVQMEYMESDGTTGPEEYNIEIYMEPGDRLFYGKVPEVCVTDPDSCWFSGVLNGRDVYFTHWDSVTTGKLTGNGKTIRFVNQAWDADPRSSKTSIGRATKGSCP